MSKLFLNFNEASIPVIKEMYWKELREMTKKEVEYSSLAYSLLKVEKESTLVLYEPPTEKKKVVILLR